MIITSNELLIPSVSPQNLERDDLWFRENLAELKKAHLVHPWWRENLLWIERDLALNPSQFTRRLAELGYERAGEVRGKGIFAVRGGIIEVWPVQSPQPFLVEFSGNLVAQIIPRPEIQEHAAPPRIHTQSIQALPAGSFVVHVDHGIGIYRGIEEQNPPNPPLLKGGTPVAIPPLIKEGKGGFFLVEYAPARTGGRQDRLLVPVAEEDRLSPYVGFETPHIHRLGGSVWQTTKKKAKEDTEKLARELLELYARREGVRRAPFLGDSALEEEVRGTFPHSETEDQLRAEEEILRDLERERPTDRVLVGDVGFGKTEIALRAAMRVIASGSQVALLAPTTILAAQHERVFRERLATLPVHVAMLSRLTPRAEEKKILAGIADGSVDCVIGTHRLLSKDIAFKNLGLVIIDEEQRFGVRQKERFKNMRSEIDILSLSATPIPRTLSLTIAKLRDISIITTPPHGRLAIRTLVLPHASKTIAAAIWHELARGGQVYFLHNRIETMGATREKLIKILERTRPSVSPVGGRGVKKPLPVIGTVHGRVGERELMRVMEAFREQKIQVLMTTTIIENGVDISSANTLIVDDAIRLGLAQAHQLRGRTGRGSDQAFAYFLFRPRHLTEKASERLTALQQYADLGSGYEIALRDLEIRGAGNILGKEQAGTVNKVGLNLYCQMLADAVAGIHGGTI